MSTEDAPPVTAQSLKDWLMSMPLIIRREKMERLQQRLNVTDRAIEKWRQGKPIPAKHHDGIREVMKGGDKVSVDFDPHIHKMFEERAKKHGFKSVAAYLEFLANVTSAVMVALLLWHILTPDTKAPAVISSAASAEISSARKKSEPDDE